MELLNLLYHLKFNQIFLWIENNSNISLSFGNNFEELIESLQEDLKYHKSNLLKILEYNKIFSEEDSKSIAYYKVPFKLNELELSHFQKSIYLHSKIEKTGYAYNVPLFIKFKNLDFERLQQSIVFILKKHPILRIKLESNFRYKIQDIEVFRIKRIIVPSIQSINQFCISKAQQQFHLDDQKLIRLELFIIENTDEAILDLTHHHILSDAYSVGVIITDLLVKYKELLSTGKSYILEQPGSVLNYFDYVNYQNYKLQTEGYIKAISTLAERLSVAEFITLKKEDSVFDNIANRINITLNKMTYQKLKQLSIDNGVSLYSILLNGFYHTLSLYSGWKKNFAIGITVSNRPFEFNKAIGPFISILPLIPQYDLSHTFLDNIKNFHEELLYLNSYQEINLNLLIEKLKYRPDNINQLIHVIFILHNFEQELVKSEDFEYLDIKEVGEKVGISVVAEEIKDSISFNVSYAANLYDENYIKSILETYIYFLNKINDLIPLQLPIQKLSYINENELSKLTNWNKTEKFYPKDRTVHQLFEEVVLAEPDKIALIYEDKQLSYRILNKRSNQLSHLLRKEGLGIDVLVGISVPRGPELVIGMLGILKSGGAYVPLDPKYPEERLTYMLKDSQIEILLTVKELCNLYKDYNRKVIYLDDYDYLTEEETNLSLTIPPDSLAYVIYTSGSTGRPKGVACNHDSFINRLNWGWKQYVFKEYETMCLQSSIAFVDSTWDIFGSLAAGARLVLYKEELGKSVENILDECNTHKITRITLVPPLLKELIIQSQENPRILKNAAKVYHWEVTGEQCHIQLVKDFKQLLSQQIKFLDCYGDTEATSIIYKDFSSTSDTEYKTYLLSNTQIYILDTNLNQVPISVIGELYIGGVSLARGYLNTPALTAERFIANPFGKVGARLYQTGDLGRYLPNGNIEFIGRVDHQVKILGYRIELGEIESVLSTFTGIKQVAVTVKENDNSNNKCLVAYYTTTSTSGQTLDESALFSYLSNKMPEYIIPSKFVHLKKLPLNVHGKLDRKALPDVDLGSSVDTYLGPRNELESKICSIFAEVLGLEFKKVGVRDDFFRLGGNSILAIRLTSKINKEVGLTVNMATILTVKNIESLVRYLENSTKGNIVITKSKVNDYKDQSLSFNQERLRFIEKYEGGTYAYNMPMVFKLDPSSDINILENSIKSLIDRHEILRTVIREDSNGNSYQEVLDREKDQDLIINRVISNSIEEFEKKLDEEVDYIFDLSNEYPIRVYIHQIAKERYLNIVIHHIAFDGWSLDIFLKELLEYYQHYSNGKHLSLKELPVQYKDYAIWQKNYLSGQRLEEQLKYWRDKLENYEELNLITDKPRPNQIDYRGKYVHFELSKELSDKIRNICKELGVSLYSALLSGYCLLLRVYSNQTDIVVGSPVANRHYHQITDLIGLFINSLVLRIKINPDMTIEDFIKFVGHEVREAQMNQDLPFEKLVSELKISKDNSRHPIFQVLFSIENFGNSIKENKIIEAYDSSIGIHKTAKFDISTFIDDSEDILRGSFNYATSLYEEKTICKFIQTYIQVLEYIGEAVCNNYGYNKRKIRDIEYLGKEEYERIVYEWNKTDKEYKLNKRITEAFEEWVEIQPDSIAVVFGEVRLTYSELNERANKLAHYLIDNYKLKADELVALCLDRSENMMVVILAVLKAGAAYVPIDPSYPDERISYILQDTDSKVVIANGVYKQRLENITKTPIIAIDDLTFWKQIFSYSSSTPKVSTTHHNLAYVIYTSGTTGNPKGVMIERIAYIETIKAVKDMYFKELVSINTYSITNYVFDIFGLEYGLPLLSGGSVEIGINDFRVLNCKYYDFIQMTPSLCQIKVDSLKNLSDTKLLIGGEKLNEQLLKKLLFKKAKVINVYGPTETTIWSSGKEYKEIRDEIASSIGLPFINEKVYVLDKNLRPLPPYAVGELYIGGIGVGRGYLNNVAVTAERFIANPFIREEEYNAKKNLKIYKTGDIVRFVGNGEIEYIGRNDSQVKVNGYRIELEEIEKGGLSVNLRFFRNCLF